LPQTTECEYPIIIGTYNVSSHIWAGSNKANWALKDYLHLLALCISFWILHSVISP
jgi:hypothetical protein